MFATPAPQAQELDNIRDIDADRIIILLGKTRAGKSTFINDLVGSEVLQTASSLTSVTDRISYVTTTIDNQRVALVDTVGFSGSDENMQRPQILADLVKTVTTESNKTPKITGIIFLVSIRDPAMTKDNQDDPDVFRAIVGDEAMKYVIFVTSKWCLETQTEEFEELKDAEEELKIKYWHKSLAAGARVRRLDTTTSRAKPRALAKMESSSKADLLRKYQQNALDVVRLILDRPATKKIRLVTEVQENKGAVLSDLSAGKMIVQQEKWKAETNKRLGLSSESQQETIKALERIKVKDLLTATQRDDYAQRAGAEVMGGDPVGRAFGSLANKAGEGIVAGAQILVGKKRGEAVEQAYPGMLETAANAAKVGARIGEMVPGTGRAGRVFGGAVGFCIGVGENAVQGLGILLDPKERD